MDAARHFPALTGGGDWAFLENAGGSAVPQQVIDSTSQFLATANWQLGAGYPGSQSAEAVVASARQLVHALASRTPDAGFAALGASTTAILAMMGRGLEPCFRTGDVLIVSTAGHESNIGPWVRAARRSGATLLWWPPQPDGRDTCPLDSLRELIAGAGGLVRMVAFPHASNLLGGIVDAAAVAAIARQAGALTFCDGVALAPHRRVDCECLGVDFYAVSLYKVFAPHIAALFGTHNAWATLRDWGCETPNHSFISQEPSGAIASWHPAYCWEPGGVSPEACAGVCGLRKYFQDLTGQQSLDDAALVDAAFEAIAAGEHAVQAELASFFCEEHAKGTLRLLGPLTGDPSARVPTFSFVPLTPGATPETVVAACHAARVACRRGSMYAPRLCEHLGVHQVVRISAVHYNSVNDARRCVDAIRSEIGNM